MAETVLPGRVDLPPVPGSVHLVGAGGAGMRGLARLLAAEGYRLTGSDRDPSAARALVLEGLEVHAEDDAGPAGAADLVVYSAAVSLDHPALVAARAHGVPTMKRARAMAALLNDRRLAAVAGTHGKTTVTAMLAIAAESAGLAPSALVGGRVPAWKGHARVGQGRLAVVEADEYDRSFLELDPSLAVVTSIEPEHLECYRDLKDLRGAFVEFAARAAGREGILVCADDPGARELADLVEGGAFYGRSPEAEYRVEILARERGVQRCRLIAPRVDFEFEVAVPGEHNAQNACGALSAALMLGASPDRLASSLRAFRGVERRLQQLSDQGGRAIVDDYAHHPTEVRASIAALRAAYPGRRVAVVFQPHLYSRTHALAAEFGSALSEADDALVLPIYPAREKPMAGVTSALIVDRAAPRVREANGDEVLPWLTALDGEVVVAFMGAGDVTDLAQRAAGTVEGDDALGG